MAKKRIPVTDASDESPDEAAEARAEAEVELDETQDDEDTLVLEEVDDDVDSVIAEALAQEEGKEIAELRAELAELRDQSMRTLADFDNFRKRTEREQREFKRYALLEPMRDLLAVVDNLERAVAADGSADDLKRGVAMTLGQLKDVMRIHGVAEVPAAGEEFDPNLHDAVSRHEDPAAAVPTVSAELQRGYLLHDRLLRPALVKVAMPADKGAARDGSEESSE